VPRDIGEIADPAAVDCYQIDEIAADLAARQRRAIELEPSDPRLDARHQQLVNLVRELDLRVGAEVARALAAEEHHEAGVGDDDRRSAGERVERHARANRAVHRSRGPKREGRAVGLQHESDLQGDHQRQEPAVDPNRIDEADGDEAGEGHYRQQPGWRVRAQVVHVAQEPDWQERHEDGRQQHHERAPRHVVPNGAHVEESTRRVSIGS
jgi:hypothetical protein